MLEKAGSGRIKPSRLPERQHQGAVSEAPGRPLLPDFITQTESDLSVPRRGLEG